MSSEDGDLIKQNEISASTKPTGVRFPARNYNDDWTRTLDAFEILATLGEGTFGYDLFSFKQIVVLRSLPLH